MKIIIFGAGQAGYTAARRLKQNMPEAEVLIFDHDACGLYAKMRLPDYVAGKVAREKLILASGDAMRSQGIEPHLGENIERIDPAGKEIFTSAGEAYSYDILILASGAKAFVPPVKGVELSLIHIWGRVSIPVMKMPSTRSSRRTDGNS